MLFFFFLILLLVWRYKREHLTIVPPSVKQEILNIPHLLRAGVPKLSTAENPVPAHKSTLSRSLE